MICLKSYNNLLKLLVLLMKDFNITLNSVSDEKCISKI